MLIIIEGADKTGKTTLAKAIAARFNYQYHHFGPPKGRPADEYIDFLLNLKKPTVCDRFHLGELVYGPIFRDKIGITPLELLTIERVLRLKQTILIHAATDITLANERLHVSKQIELVDDTRNIVAAKLFDDVVRTSNVTPLLRYDGSNKRNLNNMLKQIQKLLDNMRQTRTSYTGVGTIDGPKIVFVGEQVNKNVTWRGLPFDRGLSSEFLAQTFKQAMVDEHKVYICNADKLALTEAKTLYHKGTRFISLGKKADEKLNSLGILHTALPHPQWVKRFHHSQKYMYAEMIGQACV